MYTQQAPQAQASRAYWPQSGTYQSARAFQCDMGNQSMIDSLAQTHLNAPNGTIPAVSNTIQAVNAPQFFYTICPPVTTALQNGSYSAYAPGLPHATQADYSGYMQPYSMMPYTQAHQDDIAFRQGPMHKDAPGPENRRGIYSTNESAPGTPFYGSLRHGNRGTVLSPQTPQAGKPFPYKVTPVNCNIATFDQTIPRAVPAVFTPENARTLDQSLSNPICGNRNVYIRGLRPDTNDEILAAYARLFGSVETLKAIIDTATGACKGFGFVEYFDVRDSEKCIRGFYAQGYEVSFAKESFISRLKAKGDHSSTNLYVSNLPKSMNEMEFAAIFMNYNVVSSTILHDSQGNSYGAGFARFDSPDICEKIIRSYHGQPVGKEGLLLQVRFADTPAQKDLKKITTKRRQFRTIEYNASAYGSPVDIANISPPMSSAGVSRIAQRSGRSWKRDGPSSDKIRLSDETSAPILTPCKQEDPEQYV